MNAIRAVIEHALDVFDALHGSLAGLSRSVAGSQALLAELEMDRHGRVVQCLGIGVAKHERHIVNAFTVHVVHGIAAATANTDHFDDAVLFIWVTEIEDRRFLSVCIIVVWHIPYSLRD